MLRQCLIISALFCVTNVFALTYEITPGSDLVGQVQSYTSKKGESFADVARKFDLGIVELQEANPKIDGKKALKAGTTFVIPTQFILPNGAPHQGIILNLAELRLYYFPPNTNTVVTFPVGIGKQGWRTPIGQTTIVQKRANPEWIPPDSIRAEAEANGHELPDVIPAGPNNPLGLYALNLGWNGYRMHGTNVPSSIGTRASHGCIRMFPEDIDSLFHQVTIGTPVTVVHEPFKVGVMDGQLYFEAHEPFPEEYYTKGESDDDMVKNEVTETTTQYPSANTSINWSEVKKLIKDTYGYPVKITDIPSSN